MDDGYRFQPGRRLVLAARGIAEPGACLRNLPDDCCGQRKGNVWEICLQSVLFNDLYEDDTDIPLDILGELHAASRDVGEVEWFVVSEPALFALLPRNDELDANIIEVLWQGERLVLVTPLRKCRH